MNDPQPEGRMASHIERRKFLATLGGAAVAWPLAARAQRLPVPVIGFLDATTAADTVYRVSAFRDGLKEARVHRRPQRRDRISLGGEQVRSAAGTRGGPGAAPGGCDRRPKYRYARGPDCHFDHTDRVRQRRRSDRTWGYQSQPAARQYHGGELCVDCSTAKAPRAAA